MVSKTVFRRDVPLRTLHTVDMTLRMRVVAPEGVPVEKVLERQRYEITPSGSEGFVVEAAIAGVKVVGTCQVALETPPRRRGRPPKTAVLGGAAVVPRTGKKRRGRPKGSKNRPKTTVAQQGSHQAESQSENTE